MASVIRIGGRGLLPDRKRPDLHAGSGGGPSRFRAGRPGAEHRLCAGARLAAALLGGRVESPGCPQRDRSWRPNFRVFRTETCAAHEGAGIGGAARVASERRGIGAARFQPRADSGCAARVYAQRSPPRADGVAARPGDLAWKRQIRRRAEHAGVGQGACVDISPLRDRRSRTWKLASRLRPARSAWEISTAAHFHKTRCCRR